MWQFNTTFTWQPERDEEGLAAAGHGAPAISITPPADLGGKAGYWTPEDLLVSAVESCMLMTTLSVVKKQRIQLKAYRSEATGKMEKTPEGLRITGIEIRVAATVGAPEDVEKMQRAVQIAERYCPVSAAVSCPVHVSVVATAG
jgi:organic hydroperoxide reductase OsmC/OhrA